MTSIQYFDKTLPINTVHCMDYSDFFKFVPDHSAELILTDPPYARKYLPLYTGMAAEAKRVLRVGGSLVTMAPNFMLPEVMATMGMFLKWRWMCVLSYWHGSHARMVMGVEVCYKPVIWLVNEKLSPNRYIRDMIQASKRDKSLHKWQQDLEWALYFIKQLTDEEDLIVDPFCGSGTVPLAAEMLNRHWLACDIDSKCVDTTNKRVQEFRGAIQRQE